MADSALVELDNDPIIGYVWQPASPAPGSLLTQHQLWHCRAEFSSHYLSGSSPALEPETFAGHAPCGRGNGIYRVPGSPLSCLVVGTAVLAALVDRLFPVALREEVYESALGVDWHPELMLGLTLQLATLEPRVWATAVYSPHVIRPS